MAVPALHGNALYARLAFLMGSTVAKEEALSEMKEMGKQMAARKHAAGVTELWDAGEELCDPTAQLLGRGGGPPPKRIGPPSAVVTGTANRLHPSPLLGGEKRKPGATLDKSSSSGSEESQDASSALTDRAKASSSDTPKATNKMCIVCHESGSSPASPLLTCTTCALTTHAKCAKPPVEKEDFSSARFSYTCAPCARRPRSESPKPSAARHHSAILITAPHDKRKKAEAPAKLSRAEEAKRRKTTEEWEILGGARPAAKATGKRAETVAERKKKNDEKGGDDE